MDEIKQREIFDQWLSQHKGLFFKAVRAYAFSLNDQDDLFQEICLQVWKSIPNFKGNAKVSTWIYRVALFTGMTYSKAAVKRERGEQPLGDVEHTLVADRNQQDPRLDWLYEQIAQLNEIDRSLTLLLLDGYRYHEMADILGISESNVGVRINRIKKRLSRKSQEVTTHGV